MTPTLAHAQLALENENQHVFEYIKVEIARLKKSVGALSGVVDEELATLRAECGSLRTEVQQAVDLAKSQTEHTVNLIGESRRRDTEWMQLTYSQVKESVAKLDADVKECRAQLFELSGAHSSAVAKLGADAETHTTTLHRQVSALSERLAGTEARANTLVMEMDGSLRAEHDEVVRWMRDARPQLAALKGFESVQTLTESVHAHTAALQQRIDGSSTQLGMASEELARHRDALVLMVETVDADSIERGRLTAIHIPDLLPLFRSTICRATRRARRRRSARGWARWRRRASSAAGCRRRRWAR